MREARTTMENENCGRAIADLYPVDRIPRVGDRLSAY